MSTVHYGANSYKDKPPFTITYTPTDHLGFLIDFTFMYLECLTKLDNPENPDGHRANMQVAHSRTLG